MKLHTAGVLIALALLTSGCSGCSTIEKLTSPTPVLAGQKIDEQALGSLDTIGTGTNYLITAAAHSGKLTKAQVVFLQDVRVKMDLAHDAAVKAYNAGDAAGFSAKTQAIRELAASVQQLYAGVTK